VAFELDYEVVAEEVEIGEIDAVAIDPGDIGAPQNMLAFVAD